MINSNWWLLLQDDPTVPQRIRDSAPSLGGTVTKWQIRRAAWLIMRFLDYRDKLESFVLALFDPLTPTNDAYSQEIHPDSSRTGPFSVPQHYRFVCSTHLDRNIS